MSKRHILPYDKKNEVLKWLQEHIQENYSEDGSRYNMSSVAQFVEWRSKDLESWIFRIAGNPPKIYVEISDEKKELLFLLRFKVD